jgi:hypothetical protein
MHWRLLTSNLTLLSILSLTPFVSTPAFCNDTPLTQMSRPNASSVKLNSGTHHSWIRSSDVSSPELTSFETISLILKSFSATDNDRGQQCLTPKRCVSLETCRDGLFKDLKIDLDRATRYCNFENYHKEWDIIRHTEVFRPAIKTSQGFIDEGIYKESALQLTLFSFYGMTAAQIEDFQSCTNTYLNEFLFRYNYANDDCEVLVKSHPQDTWKRMVQCLRDDPNTNKMKSRDICIKKLFPRDDFLF